MCSDFQDEGLRVAIYTRYSTGLQRATSTHDQIRECRDAATRKGWRIQEKFIRSDEAVSGRGRVGRHGFEELMSLAQTRDRPFDGILIDDTSRFGRNLSHTLPLSDLLEDAGVFIHFANRGLDSRDPNFRQLFIACGQQDEAFSRSLGEKVRRGQRGRVLNGYVPNGRVFGYKNVPIEHPTRKGLYGRPEVEAVKLEIRPEEAEVVVRIFELYQGGLGHHAIASLLNKERIPSPLRESSDFRRCWNTPLIAKILKNQKYRGVHLWNKTKTTYSATTQCKIQRKRPAADWDRVEVPSWRIVSEELWGCVQQVNQKRQGHAARVKGGLNRSPRSRGYLFSGLLRCGECGGKMNIVIGTADKVRYGCARHRFEGTCDNALTIKQQVVESTLMKALAKNLVSPALKGYLQNAVEKEAVRRWTDGQSAKEKGTSSRSFLRRKIDQLSQQAENLVTAIAEGFDAKLVGDRLKQIHNQIEAARGQLERLIAVPSEAFSLSAIPKFLDINEGELAAKLVAQPERAKALFSEVLDELTLRPIRHCGSPCFEVGGDAMLFAGG
jgi:site-specific DNA recombinase